MKTLERLLLETLSDPESNYTVADLAALWGEDRVRVAEWLRKFVKQGLIRATCGNGYEGHPDKISDYLRTT